MSVGRLNAMKIICSDRAIHELVAPSRWLIIISVRGWQLDRTMESSTTPCFTCYRLFTSCIQIDLPRTNINLAHKMNYMSSIIYAPLLQLIGVANTAIVFAIVGQIFCIGAPRILFVA